ncbi:hypothetical protein RRG08_043549 [Elysia crispata]|uniref:Uncharacterized protein n=1 Tax=Elysia crispata TaxID=231223 RepID=A0AAE1CYJ3_9GAST|nr:hypothetical protein RRG08_043549 [Elysia crispata]
MADGGSGSVLDCYKTRARWLIRRSPYISNSNPYPDTSFMLAVLRAIRHFKPTKSGTTVKFLLKPASKRYLSLLRALLTSSNSALADQLNGAHVEQQAPLVFSIACKHYELQSNYRD